jgi:hypothetical protein
VLLASLLLAAVPASAGTNSWGSEFTKNINITSTQNMVDIANYGNGSILYGAAGTTTVYKSTNGGVSWVPTNAVAAAISATEIAVAPDDSNVIVITNGTKIYLSTNGGVTFAEITPTTVTLSAVGDIAIAPLRNGIRNIAACGTDANGAGVQLFNLGATIPGWTDIAIPTGATTDIAATVAFSPNHLSDLALLAVSANVSGSAGAYLNVYSFNTSTWNAASYFATGYPVTVATGLDTSGGVNAELAIDPNYLGYDENMRNVFVALSTGATTGGVYRVIDNAVTVPVSSYTTNPVRSIAYDGSTLVAGLANSAAVLRDTSPLVGPVALAANMANKGPSGAGNTSVTWVGANVLAATTGTNSAIALSRDGGQTFNDVAWVKTTIADATELVMLDDGAMLYYVTDDTSGAGGTVSVWRKNPTWERVLTLAGATEDYIISVAPENNNALYLGAVGANTIYYSSTGGDGRWYLRNSSVQIQDMVAESASTVYVLEAAGNVVKTEDGGYIWTSPAVATGLGAGSYSLELVSEGVLLAGGNAKVAITTNGGTTWKKSNVTGGGANMVVAADENFGVNDTIYAGSAGTNGLNILKGVVGSTNSITFSTIGVRTLADHATYGLAQAGGVLYELSANTTHSILNQYVAASWGGAITAGVYGKGTNMGNNLFLTSGSNKVWTLSNTTGGIYSLTDVIGVTIPALAAPAADYSTQSTNNIIFTLSPVSNATNYQIDIAYDSGFTQLITSINVAAPNLNVVVGPGGSGSALVAWQPGTTYYWRARAVAPLGSPWSTTRSLSIVPGAASVPTIGAPANGATIESTTPSFSWSPVAGTTQYQFQLSTDPAFGSLVYSTSTQTTAVVVPEDLTEGETYYWRVRALMPVTADWSAVANFTVAVPAPPPPATTTETITPTPTTATTTVTMPVTLTMPTQPPATTTVVTVSVPAQPQPTTITFTQEAPAEPDQIAPSYIWAIIIIGAVLVIAVIVLIVRTRRTV